MAEELRDFELPLDRMEALGPDYVAVLALDSTFDIESDTAMRRRRLAYDGLPKQLSSHEVLTLADNVATIAQADPKISSLKDIHRVQVRALRWLGNISYVHGDERTSQNATEVLRCYGVRGKLAAIALQHQKRKI